MSKSHNKKRNAGLLYEFLVRTISKALVEGDQRRSAAALRLIKRHFKAGTQLHKEYRLINSLVRITVTNEAVAMSILQEAKAAARTHDVKQLDKEKSLLISSINKVINNDDFFDQPIAEYKTYATVQSLINDWRNQSDDIGRRAQYEDQIVSWMVSKKDETHDTLVEVDNPGQSRLLMKVMMRKLNAKYANVLTEQQRRLLRAYAFSTANDDPNSIKMKLLEVKTKLLDQIDSFKLANPEDSYVISNLAEVRTAVASEDLTSIDDDVVTRFMLYTKLYGEMTPEEQ